MHRFMTFLSRGMAFLGGLILTALILLTCVSVLGRGINTFLHSELVEGVAPSAANSLLATGVGPILGDYELVEAGIAFTIFAFLPLCQITGGHATVDIFTARLSRRVNRGIQLIVEMLFAAVLILIALRLYEGMLSKLRYNETTFLLQMPIWWAYAASLVAACVAALVGTYMALVRLFELLSGRTIVETAAEVDH